MISPLLANVYLHYVLDLWVERWRRREATGDMIIVFIRPCFRPNSPATIFLISTA